MSGLVESPQLRSQVGRAARAETEQHGWSAATEHLRNRQYAAALRKKQAKRRFGLLRLRIFAQWLAKVSLDCVLFLVRWLVYQFDYAAPLRSPARKPVLAVQPLDMRRKLEAARGAPLP